MVATLGRFPDPDTWLPQRDLRGQPCELALEIHHVATEELVRFLNHVLRIRDKRALDLYMINLPVEQFEQMPLERRQEMSARYRGVPVVAPGSAGERWDDGDTHMTLSFGPVTNTEACGMPSPENWLARGDVGTYRSASTIDLERVSDDTVVEHAEAAVDYCLQQGYAVYEVGMPLGAWFKLTRGTPRLALRRVYAGVCFYIYPWYLRRLRIDYGN